MNLSDDQLSAEKKNLKNMETVSCGNSVYIRQGLIEDLFDTITDLKAQLTTVHARSLLEVQTKILELSWIPLNLRHDVIRRIQDRKLWDELRELEHTLQLINDADMRGIKMWQEATGRTMEWPDRGKMIFWLLEKIEVKKA